MSTAITVVPGGSIMPAMSVQQASERYNVLVEFTKTVMVKDQDYGTIPGVNKPCLYKAGAEKLSSLFGLAPAFELIEKREDWTGRESNGEPLFYYFYKCKLYRGGELVGEADGSCNSWEKKYRYRDGKRKCPKCGGEFIITGKAEYGGGFLCFAKKGGCGAKFRDGDESITKQSITAVPNPDIPEVINTVQKMAQKRALVAAVLIACNASAFYTQDVEDMRTIDVDYEPFEGSRENQREYLADKGLEPFDAKAAALARQKPVPQAIREFANIDPEPAAIVDRSANMSRETQAAIDSMTAQQPIADIEMRHASQVAEANAVLKETAKAPKRKRGQVSFDVLKHFGEIKKLLRDASGDDSAYYQILQANGFTHADEITDNDKAREVYRAMGMAHKRMLEEKKLRTEMELAHMQHGVDFINLLGVHGCENIDDTLNLASEPLELLRTAIKALRIP